MARFPRARRGLEQLLRTQDTPARTAAAYALGVFFGFSPLLGLHTILGLFCAFALNLNRVAVLLGVYSNLPWFVLPYYTLATWLGAAILGVEVPAAVVAQLIASLENRSWADFRVAAANLRPVLSAFMLGSTIGSIVLSLIAYRIAFATIASHRNHSSHPQSSEM